MQYTYTFLLALFGFSLAYHIWHTKTRKQQLVCILGKDCNKAIESEHAETLGVENTVLGMLYYSFVIIASLVAILYPLVLGFSLFSIGALILTGAAALFSIYLVCIQSFVLKHFCEYCLGSTAIVFAIFAILLL
ncbi:MAG: vitamin K epoxide reductase family protein [Nanoarchaeota archaeon]